MLHDINPAATLNIWLNQGNILEKLMMTPSDKLCRQRQISKSDGKSGLLTPMVLKGFGKLSVDLEHGVDFLRGKTSGQAEKAVFELRATSEAEAAELNQQYGELSAEVMETGASFNAVVEKLRRFEEEKLGMNRTADTETE